MKSDRVCLEQILDAAGRIREFTSGLDLDA